MPNFKASLEVVCQECGAKAVQTLMHDAVNKHGWALAGKRFEDLFQAEHVCPVQESV